MPSKSQELFVTIIYPSKRQRGTMTYSLKQHQMVLYGRVHFKMHYFFMKLFFPHHKS